jgi:hypothetical protein
VNIVHLTKTPLAGSPSRIVAALNAHTTCSASLIVGNPDHYGERVFEGGLDWRVDRDAGMALIEKADILHIHRYMDLSQKPFGLDFDALAKQGKILVRQFHANPNVIANRLKIPVETVVNDPLPQLVISQFHERFYPRARLVPNIVPIHDERYMPLDRSASPTKLFFGPSEVRRGAWDSRWETKGAPETVRLLKRISRQHEKAELVYVTDTPHEQCLSQKRACQVAIDELCTGSFHLASLESLSQGLPTLAYLDARMVNTLRAFTGASDLPWINVHLSDSAPIIRRLIEDETLRRDLGVAARAWMETYWDDKDMVQHYVRAYQDLVDAPEKFTHARFDSASSTTKWKVGGFDDAIWEARKRRANGSKLSAFTKAFR